MNRAMFSGVAGLKTHQTKMDVIGNNIANVNTYGFKTQRAVFSDMYYQALRNASAGTASRGGLNPSSVGYGSTLAGIQTQMSQSSMQSTGFGLDVAITGEGFLQVMDPDGNIFYTKAGMLDYDSNGYLTDINGNFVLGTSATGVPGTQKIRLDDVGSVNPAKPSVTEQINGVNYTVTASNASKYGNVSLSLAASQDLPAGMKAAATISNTGAITVQLNAFEKFDSMTDLNNAINNAITEANGGKQHQAGVFTISSNENKFGVDAVAGTFTGDAKLDPSKIDLGASFGGKLEIQNFNPEAAKNSITAGQIQFTTTKTPGTQPQEYSIKTNINGIEYTADKITATSAYPVKFKSAKGGSFDLALKPGFTFGATDLEDAVKTPQNANVTAPEFFLGGVTITQISNSFPYSSTMKFEVTGLDPQKHDYNLTVKVGGKTYKSATKATPGSTLVLSTDDPNDGTITVAVPSVSEMAKNLGLDMNDPNFHTTLNTAIQNSVDKHTYNTVASKPAQTAPLTGAEIVGTNFGVLTGNITGDIQDGFFGGGLTFMKTSSDFKGQGTVTGKDFTASFTPQAGDKEAFWTVELNLNGKTYTADISEGTVASSLLLKGPDGDYIQVTNPGFKGMSDYFRSQQTPPRDPAPGDKMQAMTGNKKIEISPATKSRDLGLSSKPFMLQGGTEGGAITLDELTSIAIGADGTVSVSHPDKGTVVAGRISLANFANPSGLELQGTSYYAATVNSGDPILCDPGSDGTGGLKSNALEMSNVDLSSEFADMITTQRGFQANSRIITVSDTMLEELINLKR